MKIREKNQKIENKKCSGCTDEYTNQHTNARPVSHHFHLLAGPGSPLPYSQFGPGFAQVLFATCGWRGGMSHKLNLTEQMTMVFYNKAKSIHSPFTFMAMSIQYWITKAMKLGIARCLKAIIQIAGHHWRVGESDQTHLCWGIIHAIGLLFAWAFQGNFYHSLVQGT